MPNFDGTGPAGQGTKTGAQLGECEDTRQEERPIDGRGGGKGCCSPRRKRRGLFSRLGFGRGRRGKSNE
ncbi:DUF5320 domain-containing protein [Candidatus Parcubacteria bacterium]|jgi:hypothetical protein|nr:DUF5320 domain-containing protein [Candidatus Parcubacteria bacterium]MBT3949388.1 DUF5320 domain-containing protein [Candidatus Parcubacteria bacterium]